MLLERRSRRSECELRMRIGVARRHGGVRRVGLQIVILLLQLLGLFPLGLLLRLLLLLSASLPLLLHQSLLARGVSLVALPHGLVDERRRHSELTVG